MEEGIDFRFEIAKYQEQRRRGEGHGGAVGGGEQGVSGRGEGGGTGEDQFQI